MSSSTPGTTAANGAESSLAANAVGGAVAGAAACVLGYLFAYVTRRDRVEEGLSGINFSADPFGGDPVSVWRGVGWLFYDAHLVGVSVPSLIGAARSVNFVSQATRERTRSLSRRCCSSSPASRPVGSRARPRRSTAPERVPSSRSDTSRSRSSAGPCSGPRSATARAWRPT